LVHRRERKNAEFSFEFSLNISALSAISAVKRPS